MKIIWELMVLLGYRIYEGLSRGCLRPILGHFDRQMLFSLFSLLFWSMRDHGSLVKSTYEEHPLVVAMTSSEGGIQFHLLASYFPV